MLYLDVFLANKNMLRVKNRNKIERYELFSKLTIKYQKDVSGIGLVSLLLALNIFQVFS